MKSVERLCLDGTLLGKSLLGGNFAWRGQKLMAAPSHWLSRLLKQPLNPIHLSYTLSSIEVHWVPLSYIWVTLSYTTLHSLCSHSTRYTELHMSSIELHWVPFELHWAPLSYTESRLSYTEVYLSYTEEHWPTQRHIEVHAVQAGGWENRKYCQTIFYNTIQYFYITILQLFCSRASWPVPKIGIIPLSHHWWIHTVSNHFL